MKRSGKRIPTLTTKIDDNRSAGVGFLKNGDLWIFFTKPNDTEEYQNSHNDALGCPHCMQQSNQRVTAICLSKEAAKALKELLNSRECSNFISTDINLLDYFFIFRSICITDYETLLDESNRFFISIK